MTAQPFDALKAAREVLAGLSQVMATMRRAENAAEEAMGKAESELNAIRQLRAFAQAQLAGQRKLIERLEAEAQGR